MNAGAAAATGDILLFLHGDTLLPRGYDDSARRALANPSAVAGAFELKIDARSLGLPAGRNSGKLPIELSGNRPTAIKPFSSKQLPLTKSAVFPTCP